MNTPQPSPTLLSNLLPQETSLPAENGAATTTPEGSTPTPVEGSPDEGQVVVQVETGNSTHSISPLIYGLSGGEDDYLQALHPALLSWGGNPSTRYNWKLGNAWNAGKDWFYSNVTYDFPDGVSAGDEFFKSASALGIETRLAIPTLGWVAKDRQSCSFPQADGTCGDGGGATCEQAAEVADPNTANVPSDPSSITAWLAHLKDQGYQPRFIAMDNEPELWGYTHYDVHPECTTYEEVLEKYLSYADAIRAAAPNSELSGPVACCWFSYWNIAPGPASAGPETPRDYISWFLNSVRMHDENTGLRTLDVLDVHFYPQSDVYNDNVDAETAARRLRSTRALWDTTYSDESWIDQPIYFIPRMKKLIDQYYPGTRLGISEWNFGADGDINGALAIADVLGIFGREDVYYAAYWRNPPLNSPGFYAFKLYTNYDDAGSGFNGASILAESNHIDKVASYAAMDAQKGRLMLMLINKLPDQSVPVQVKIGDFAPQAPAEFYRFDATHLDGIVATKETVPGSAFSIDLPAYSITLVVLTAQ